MTGETMHDDRLGTAELAALFRLEADATAVIVDRAFRMTDAAATRDLTLHLYRRLHTRNTTSSVPVAGRSWRHAGLEARLVDATPRRASTARARVLSDTGDDHVLVRLDGLRVRVPRSALLPDTGEPAAGPTTLVRVPSMRPAVSPGFFLVDGAAGPGSGALAGGTGLLRLYVSLTDPETAPALWHDLLGALDDADAPYRAKICSHPAQYPRADALVVYLGPESWRLVPVVTGWAERRSAELGDAVSGYAARLGPGVAAAWEPQDSRTGFAGLSFGQHRSLLTAVAVRDVATGASAGPLDAALRESFERGGVLPSAPACGAGDPHPVELLGRDRAPTA